MDDCSKDTNFSIDISWIHQETRIVIRRHAFEQMYSRRISEEEVEEIIRIGKIIESYPDDYPFPSALICGYLKNRSLHVVAAFNRDEDEIIVITTYEPDEIHFESGIKRRRL
ncbi:DUF4258 domain-containing protein [Methanospirillum stamsii]|uniref:DUF4258 domain-containing protein n=1 Tax=Methanospirillum stamsii TaxID=1277351 RepID=A0A2V2N2U3_9EURY|nr:DUF4258 domain-containing protein [Methanospirillum stamsii]PWR74574.1 hypothetical protein DLD82_08295 [Methanospirillum stamsii]